MKSNEGKIRNNYGVKLKNIIYFVPNEEKGEEKKNANY